MQRYKLLIVAVLVVIAALTITATGCGHSKSSVTSNPSTISVIKPEPTVAKVTASTSGVQNNYYADLDITVKNNGADGTILVKASVTQVDNTSTQEQAVFIKGGQTQELKMTFHILWEVGDWTPSVQAVVP